MCAEVVAYIDTLSVLELLVIVTQEPSVPVFTGSSVKEHIVT